MRKIGGLIALVLAALLVIVGCDNSTVTNDDNGEWINHINGIIATQPDTSWFDENDTTPNKKYELTTANELYGLMELVNGGESFEGDTINLAKGTYDFTQVSEDKEGESSFIGSGDRDKLENANAFAGEFYGNGATIKGVDLNYPAGYQEGTVGEANESNIAVGFFGVVKGTSGNHAVVENLVFEDCNLYSTSNTTGIAVGYAEYADISNITVRNCVITGPQGVGGVVGRLYEGGKITECQVENTTISADAAVVDYDGTKTGNYNAGGIVGCASGSGSTIEISGNSVTLGSGNTISATDMFAGGICGYAASIVTFSDNHVTIADAARIDGGAGAKAPICAGGAGLYGSTANTITIGSQQAVEIKNKAADTFAP